MTTPPDYQQQLATYLGAWRQLLEALTTLATATPLPGVMPGYAPTPVSAPPPQAFSTSADHTQQMFGYLQAWRRYLEQTAEQTGAGAAPHSPAAKGTAVPVPPQNPDVSRSQHHDDSPGRSPKRPPTAVTPANEGGSQMPADALRAPVDRRATIPRPPALETGTQIVPLLTGREGASMTPPAVDRLFRGLQDRTPGIE